LPYVGGLGGLLFGQAPQYLQDVSYGMPAFRGGNVATGGLGTITPDTRMLDVATLPFVGAGAAKAGQVGAKTLGKEVARQVETGTGLIGSNVLDPRQYATAYHGSPYLFDKFDPKKIGTGQGQQSYGYGTYFSENPKVADYYKYQLKPTEEFLQKVNKGEYNDLQKLVTEGNMYKVDIPDEYIPKMLDFEKPLYKQSNEVKQLAFEYKPGLEERLKFLGGDGIFDLTGSDLFGVMQRYSPNSSKINTQNITSKEISDKMLSKGIMGSKYYDASSKDALANKAYNYVLFDPSNVKILDINDKGLLK
jgi:hypothetical protein